MSRRNREEHPPTLAELTPRQRREHWAATGEVEPLLQELQTLDPTLLDHEYLWTLVLEALEVRARQNPEAFADTILARMIGFTSYLAIRSQVTVQGRLRRHDRESSGAEPLGLPPELTEALTHLASLQGHVAGLLECQATVKRKWKLAKAGRQNGKPRAKPAKAIEILPVEHERNGHAKHLNGQTSNGVSINGHVNRLNGKHDHGNGNA